MKLGYKIAIGTAIGFGLGYGTWRIIYEHRRKSAEATINQQKEMLIQQILILQGQPVNEENKKIWRNKSVEELQQWLEQNTAYFALPEGDDIASREYFDPNRIIQSDISSYMSVSSDYGYGYIAGEEYSNYKTYA